MTKSPRRILIVDDIGESSEEYKHQLNQDANFACQISIEPYNIQTFAFCYSQQLDGIILDLHSSHGDSLNFLSQLKKHLGENCPPIVVVGSDDAEVAVRAFKNGATDYLIGDRISPDDLRLAIRRAIESAQLKGKLQRDWAQFQISVENMMDCFGIFSSLRDESGQIEDFRIDYLNEAACENNCMKKEMQLGRGLCELLPNHRESGLFDKYCRLVKTGKPLIEESLVYEDTYGEQRLVRAFDIRATKFEDGFVASWRDVTSRKRLELELNQTVNQLRQEQNRLQRLINTAPIGIGIGSVNGEVKMINDAMLRLHGLTREEFEQAGMNWRQFIPPEEVDRTEREMAQFREQGFVPSREKLLLRRDGTRVPVWISGIRWLEGTDEHVSYAVDLTQLKQTEAALRQSEDRLRMAIESAQLGTWDWNLVTERLIWDKGCKAMFGLPADVEVTIETFYAGLHPEDRDRLEKLVRASLNPEGNGNYDTEYRTIGIQDGIERWIAAKGQVYFDGKGTPLRFVGTVLNITEQKQAQALRERLLKREQAAREEAEHANHLKDEFLAILSHELRTPLNPILGWANLLQSGKFSETQTNTALATIERNARLQSQLIDDLLDVARILRGKLVIKEKATDLAQVIENALDTLRTAAEVKSISLEADLPSIGQISGDAARLQQIVWNLLTNAIKFTPRGGRVKVCLKRVENQAQVTVSDTGKGISAEFLPQIFESFRQQDVSINRQFGGLGLGLAIVRYLVKAHQGTITAHSPGEGQGATFTVSFPLLNLQLENRQGEEPKGSDIDLTGVRVLAVDDEPDAREVLAASLTHYGAEVTVATSAMEALEIFEAFQPDVLVSDIGMPEVDGYSLIEKIRALPPEKGGEVNAIALTAYAREENRQQALTSGYQAHIAKPLEPAAFVQLVAELS
ncbi:hybrid sensor histidine kinase/response regulator [Myxosarcina sp. GI1(2024)]